VAKAFQETPVLVPGNVVEGVQGDDRVEVPGREGDRQRVRADELSLPDIPGRLLDVFRGNVDPGHAVPPGKSRGHGNTGRAAQVENGRAGLQPLGQLSDPLSARPAGAVVLRAQYRAAARS
jgi:hypothetical protein